MTKDKIDFLIIACTFNQIFYASYPLPIKVYFFQMIFLVFSLIFLPLGLAHFVFGYLSAFIPLGSQSLVIKFHDEFICLYSLPDDILRFRKTIHLQIICET